MQHTTDSIIATTAGFVTVSITKWFELVHIPHMIQALILGFIGAAGGWLFGRCVAMVIEYYKKNKKDK